MKKDIIIRNNIKLSLSLLQVKIYNLNSIKMAIFEMFGRQLALWGCLKNDSFLCKENNIILYCENNFADYEIPEAVIIWKNFLLTESRKINRMESKIKYMDMKSEV